MASVSRSYTVHLFESRTHSRTREGFFLVISFCHARSKRAARVLTSSPGGSFHMSSNCRGFLETPKERLRTQSGLGSTVVDHHAIWTACQYLPILACLPLALLSHPQKQPGLRLESQNRMVLPLLYAKGWYWTHECCVLTCIPSS